MHIDPMRALTIKFKKSGREKTYIFDTEEKALACYHKYKGHHLVEKIALNYTNALKKIKKLIKV